MSELIIFVSSGLLVYWLARTWMLLRATDEEISETLESDRWWFRRIPIELRGMFLPPMRFVG